MVNEALPFFERFSNRGELLDLLARDDEEAERMRPGDAARAIRAVSLALLDHGVTEAERIARKKMAFIGARSDLNLAELEKFLHDSGILPAKA